MKINNNTKITFNNIYKIDKLKNQNYSNNRANKDRVEISELGKYLSKVNSNEESMDIEKVNRLKKQIESGTYKVDSRELAKKIIEKL
ncbi:flagellar biosynthesis anti-sigma factor FlgM [Paraclostridium bifermentans]|uniref:flagellar biosynthesis anti-sigma factor FlgM n=1 Tax=Paraclostridium bifermentans TaxID=1490 RepID=UPI00359C144B